MVEPQRQESTKAASLMDKEKLFRRDTAPLTNRFTNPLLDLIEAGLDWDEPRQDEHA